MAGKHMETFALKLDKKMPEKAKNGNILFRPKSGLNVSGW